METGFGRTRETKESGVYNVVFSYVEESVGEYAAEASVRIAEALISGEDYDLEADIQKMREIRERVRLGPSTGSIVEEAVAAGIESIIIVTGRNKKSIEDHFDKSVELDQQLEAKGKLALLDNVRSIGSMASIHYLHLRAPSGLRYAIL